MKNIQQTIDLKEKDQDKTLHFRHFRTGLLLFGSAIFGGVAVALWNQRTLARLREQHAEKSVKPSQSDEDAIY
ncbi:MAG TPA: hypothetical protein VHT24_16360 [Pseudacidobacterium sp.]|jgi:hypothetical protein|nr:hypothetical protein [Pseudacidobacterium sp.]